MTLSYSIDQVDENGKELLTYYLDNFRWRVWPCCCIMALILYVKGV